MKKLLTVMLLVAATNAFAVQYYTAHSPISITGATTPTIIQGDSISGGSLACITLTNCSNVIIRHCKLINSTSYGVRLVNCTNILVDTCDISNVMTGVNAQNCIHGYIRVLRCNITNVVGPYPAGQAVQFNNVTGAFLRICNNRIENITGQSHPEDIISIYKSYGLSADPVLIQGNWIRGGSSSTGAGITVGDQGGGFIVVKYNRVVNSGADGIQVAGGHDIKITRNLVYGEAFSYSHIGLGMGNYTSPFVASYNIEFSFNQCCWYSGKAGDQLNGSVTRLFNYNAYGTIVTTTGWDTNKFLTITAAILPAILHK